MNKIGTLDIIKAYLGNKGLSANNAYIGEIPLIKGSKPVPVPVPNDEIWYSSTDGNVVAPNLVDALPTIVSNTYVDGKGVIKFATDLISIGNEAFNNCDSLTSVKIPNSVTSIGEGAFAGCSNLTSLSIPNSVTSIGNEAFNKCGSLTSVTIPNSVTSIGSQVFSSCYNLISIIVESGNTVYDSRNECKAIIETATNTLIYGCQNTIIPNSVTDIGAYAFYYCNNLTSITISNNINSIGKYAFSGCNGLTTFTIPNSVTIIEDSVFKNCQNFTSVIIPNSVTSIGAEAFYQCSGLTTLTIRDSVTSIGANAFGYCSGLTTLTIPDSVTSIGANAFRTISAKILFSKLYSTYTNKIFFTPITNTTYTFNVEFNISEIPTDYNISSMLPQHTGGKGTITYNIYTDYEPCKVQALALANSKTIVNVYHIDGTSWT